MSCVAPVVALTLNNKRDVENHIEIWLYVQMLSNHKMPHLGNLYSVFSVITLGNNLLCCDAASPHRAVSLRNQTWSFPVGKLLFHFNKIRTEEWERANNLFEESFGKVGLQTYRIIESFRFRKTIKIMESVFLYPHPHITVIPLSVEILSELQMPLPYAQRWWTVTCIHLLLKSDAFKCICTVT